MQKLAQILGPNILKGRVENHDFGKHMNTFYHLGIEGVNHN